MIMAGLVVVVEVEIANEREVETDERPDELFGLAKRCSKWVLKSLYSI